MKGPRVSRLRYSPLRQCSCLGLKSFGNEICKAFRRFLVRELRGFHKGLRI